MDSLQPQRAMTILFSFLCFISISCFTSCKIATPFRGPGYDLEATQSTDQEVVVALTHVVLGSDSAMNQKFWDFVFSIEKELPKTNGMLGYSIRKKLFSDEGWTMSVWIDEESLIKFVNSGLHKRAAEESGSAIKGVRYARIKLPKSQTPISWEMAEELLAKNETAIKGQTSHMPD
jgi:heme-degrading monooxygenase HmoA